MFISFINFNGEVMNISKTFNIESGNKNNKSLDYAKNEYFQLKVYELFFIKHITLHFDKVFKYVIKKEEIFLSNIKFKNMYVIDLSTNMIIFDLLSLRVTIFLIQKSNKNKHIFKNQRLWQEILHHSKILFENYKADDFKNLYDSENNFYRV
jgi:hypothetical protein